jgi:hypothetical protein
MATLSTTAWVLHDLGIATGFGGSLFGKLALHPAVDAASSNEERGRIVNAAWRTYAPVNLLGHVAFALTWAIGRAMLSGRSLGRDTRALVLVKDALVIGSVATGVTSQLLGKSIEKEGPGGGVPLEEGATPAPEASARAKTKVRLVSAIGTANLLCNAGLVAITAILAMKSSRSGVFSAIQRILP